MKALLLFLGLSLVLVSPAHAQFSSDIRPNYKNAVDVPSGFRLDKDKVRGTFSRRGGIILMGTLENYTRDTTFDDVVIDGVCLDNGGNISGSGYQELSTMPPGVKRSFRLATRSRHFPCSWKIKVIARKRQRTRAGPRSTYGNFTNVKFIRCYDGDTCTFDIPYVHPLLGERISVRIRGIDVPEIKGECRREKALAKNARRLVNKRLSKAGRIDLVDVGRGKKFRISASVVADGKDLAGVLVKKGLAVRYGRGKKRGWCE